MAWHRFKVKGKHYMTKRMRTLDVIARSDVAAKQRAISKKLLPPFICEEIDFEPPSEKLLEEAVLQGIAVPENASGDDVNSLIESKNDIAPPAGLIAFAERWDIYFSQYIGNKALFNITFKNLPQESSSAFFVFSVYKFLSKDKKTNLDTHPYREIFYKFAAVAANDTRLLRSIANYKGENLCAFGTTEGLPADYKAGGVRTIAYKTAAAFIEEYFDDNYQPRALKDSSQSQLDKSGQEKSILSSITPASTVKSEKNREISPAVFILSKTDTFVPTRAIELKNKIVKIPDLENKAAADLPIYSQKAEPVRTPMRYEPTNNLEKKFLDKSGCLAMLAVLVIIVVIIVFLLF